MGEPNAVERVRTFLAVGLIVWLAVVGLGDIWLGRRYGYAATVSAVIQDWARQWPVLPLLIGLLLGHLFWPLRPAM